MLRARLVLASVLPPRPQDDGRADIARSRPLEHAVVAGG